MARIAAAAYPLSWFDDWRQTEEKLSAWVVEAAGQGADLLLFPEYAGMELATLAGADIAADLKRSVDAVTKQLAPHDELLTTLAARHGVHICAGTAPVRLDDGRVVNRARLIAPSGYAGHQDKLILTPYEREVWSISPGQEMALFATALGRIGITICFDAEFPLIPRALVQAGAEIILVPSATDTRAGAKRVRIGAMARALEGQCVVVQAPLVGPAAWSPAVDISYGSAAIFCPPDHGFPETGVLAEGAMDQPGWVTAEADLNAITHVRRHGQVLNHSLWTEQDSRLGAVSIVTLD